MDLKQLGPYRVIRKLGEGAMGTVYQGVHEQTQQVAALKLLAPGLARQQGFRIRFESEIETLRKLEHPNIVQCLGFGEQDGVLFYAMEFVEGASLDEQLESGRRFTWREVVQIGTQVCRALKHAHDRGVIHRDLKPANLMMMPDSQVKLADFGIAKLYGHTSMTMPGGPIGTASYMSPEQAEGEPVTGRSDLYSLGGVFYALLAGRPPFVSHSLTQMLRMQQSEIPEPVSQHVPGVPPELEAIIRRLLEKKPEDRFPHAAALAKSLEAVEQAVALRDQVAAPPPEGGKPKPSPSTRGATLVSRSRLGQTDPTIDHGAALDGATLASPRSEPPDLYELADDSTAAPKARAKIGSTVKISEPDALGPESPEEAKNRGTVFITAHDAAEHDRRRAEEEEREHPYVIATSTVVIAVLLVVVAAGVWWIRRPPSPEKLLASIAALVEDESDEGYEKASVQIAEFERLYPQDPRLESLKPIEDEAKFIRLERQLRNKARRLLRINPSSPLERIYLEALSYVEVDPERGRMKLQAMVNLYNDPAVQKTDAMRDYLVLAHRTIQRIDEQTARYAADHLRLIKERLERAEALVGDNPQRAHHIAAAVVEIYGGKQWAQREVERARELIEQLPPPAANDE